MTWVKLDDQFPINRKVGVLPDNAFRLHVEAICWCARNRTDGVVSREDLPHVTRIGKPARLVTVLVQRGLWHEPGQPCPSEGCAAPAQNGWVIHDYLAYNPSKERLGRERELNAERQRRWRDQHKPKDDGVTRRVTNGVTNGAPVPTRPVPSGGSSTSVGSDRARESTEPPPPRCQEHLTNPTQEPCRACGDARKSREAWEAEKARRLANAPHCRIHRGQLAHNCGPCRSERLVLRAVPEA